MDRVRVLGGAAVLWITAVLGIVATSLFVSNDLFRGSGYGRAVAVALVFFIICFLAIVLAGGPSRSWERTPYW